MSNLVDEDDHWYRHAYPNIEGISRKLNFLILVQFYQFNLSLFTLEYYILQQIQSRTHYIKKLNGV